MKAFIILLFLSVDFSVHAQELYPNTEPASTIPKNALGFRLMTETFNEYGVQRNQFTLRAMYGLLTNLTVFVQSDFSNHHDTILPRNLLTHTHNGNQVNYVTQGKIYGVDYPYLFGGIYAYAKYRFYAHDEQQKHFRMALYAEGSTTDVAHDEAEPGLNGDTKGYGGGIIVTQLLHRFAVSFTGGVVIPGTYHDYRLDYSLLPPDGPELKTDITYGRALNYDLSFGYLLYPKVYRDYKQANVNVYLELIGRSYEAAKIIRNGHVATPLTPTLKSGNYVDATPGVQVILNSNTRIDFSVGLNLIDRSYRYFYPVYLAGIQHYFYL